MEVRRINLYEYFNLPKEEGASGYLTVYSRTPSKEIGAKKRPAMLVIPGGGYTMVSDREGEPVAIRFLVEGYCAFVLTYTTHAAYPVPLIEAGMAMAYIREHAEEYCVDGEKVAAVGFSAGGHLTGMLATMYGEKEVKDALGERAALVRPDAAIFSYPVVTTEDAFTHGTTKQIISGNGAIPPEKVSIEKRVTSDSVPAFIWHTFEDDCVPVENSLLLACAYKKAGVPFALHIFEKGWHGLSLSNAEVNNQTPADLALAPVGKWVELALDWLQARGFAVKTAG